MSSVIFPNSCADDEELRAYYTNDWGTTIPKEICKQRIAEIDAKRESYSSDGSYSCKDSGVVCNSDDDCLLDTPEALQQTIDRAKEKARELGDCESAEELLQLAKWLTELQSFRREMHEYKEGDKVWYGCFAYVVTAVLGHNNYTIWNKSGDGSQRVVNARDLEPYTPSK